MVPLSETADEFFNSLLIFRDLTPQQLATTRKVLRSRELSAGDQLITEEQQGDVLYVIAVGSVRICAQGDKTGSIIAVRGPGEVVGEMSVLDGKSRSASVIAQEPTQVFELSHIDFWNVLWEIPPIPYNLSCLLAQRVRVLTSQVRAMATLDIPGRLARQLLTLAEEYGRPHSESDAIIIPFHLKQAELADMIGAKRAEVNRLLSTWTQRGFISRDGMNLVIHQSAVLEKYTKKPARKS